MADSSKPMTKEGDRRSFLKIGAGVVAGAVVAGVATDAYLSSVIGTNNSNSSSTVSSLSNQLASTQLELSSATQALNSTAGQLSAANSQVATLTGQLSSSQAALSSANSQLSSVSSQLTSTQQQLTSANAQVTTLNSQVTSANAAASTASAQATSLQGQLDTTSAFLSLSTTEQVELAAICNTIIPTDSSGPGAKTAGSIYFIDRQLKGVYGTSGLMFTAGPYFPANTTSTITVPNLQGVPITYTGTTFNATVAGTSFKVVYPTTGNVRVGAGTRYQYSFTMKQFWTIGLAGIQNYANATYGGNFETLSAANQTQCLTDIWNNKPTYDGANGTLTGGAAGGYQEVVGNINGYNSGVPGGTQFGAILPSDFAYELFFMVWNGYWVDPVYGGNKNMVGWEYVGFYGVNMGDFYNEGYTSKQLMVLTSPLTLKPASLGQYQKGSP